MIKRAILLFSILFTALNLSAASKGVCGSHLYFDGQKALWTLTDDGVLTIYGEGETLNSHPSGGFNPGFYSYSTKINSVVIEEGIKSIGSFFFFKFKGYMYDPDASQRPSYNYDEFIPSTNSYFSNITSITLCDGLQIHDYAFGSCSNLAEIEFDELKDVNMGAHIFTGTAIKRLFIPKTGVSFGTRSFMRCPLEQVIIAKATPDAEEGYIGEYVWNLKDKEYQYKEGLTPPDVYVPDVEAYKLWKPTPQPMLKELTYSLEDAATGNLKIESNIPGYEVSTDYVFDRLTLGQHTVTIPVKFTGERTFETDVTYTYSITPDGEASIDDIETEKITVTPGKGVITISGSSSVISIFNMTGAKVYEGIENCIPLPSGIYAVKTGATTVKVIVE
ncbi:leucine-rich repeat protein [uncultured Muribaculum sp.]|uniref:leucine-rich repeat protein n=1 Tax=uncultured Muribaculum sp. TaxID=1918613 RepID=UPI002592BFD4|nr:leucine-rich repeat protein [uncultured Muribaculum sp.]